MNTQEIAKMLLSTLPLTELDIARLLLESVEAVGNLTTGKNRYELLALLREMIRAGAQQLHAAHHSVSLREAVLSSIHARRHLRPTSQRDLRFYARRLIAVEGFADVPLNQLSTQNCRQLLETAFGSTSSLYTKGRMILHSVFTYGARREWCSKNPVKHISIPKRAETHIAPLSLSEIERLKNAVRKPVFKDMKLSLMLLLYCGIRPNEVARLKSDDICWNEKQVIIQPRTSKTGGGRIVPIRCSLNNIPLNERVIPRNWNRRWRALRRAAGFRQWHPDRCRHTFASYHAAHFHNLFALQMEMGHRDATLLRTRYVTPAKPTVAAKFWKTAEL